MVIVMNAIVTVEPEKLAHYRSLVADIEGLSDLQRDEIIYIVVNMMQAFVDAAWGQHPIQLALSQRDDLASQKRSFCDSFNALGEPECGAMDVDLCAIDAPEGAITQSQKEEYAP
ncbi:MAG: hypothetical protein O9253_01500 [Aquidulcibacter sp.]|nr:hypothetical protein [Aquidulcibacter sp.]